MTTAMNTTTIRGNLLDSLWIGIASIVILISSIWLANAQSQPPAPSSTIGAQSKQDKTAGDSDIIGSHNQPSGAFSASGNQAGSPAATGKQRSNSESGDSSSLGNTFIVVFTGFLVVLAGFQFWAMHRQAGYIKHGLRLSIKQARIANRSAIAAKSAADVARRSLEVAYQAKVGISSIMLADPIPRFRTMNNDTTLSRCCVEMNLVNTGSTVARNFSFEYLIDIYGLEGAINPPVMIQCDPTDLHSGIPFQRMSLPVGSIFPDAHVLWRYAVEGRNLTVSGHFSYWDIFDNHIRGGYFARITTPPNLQLMNPIEIAFEVNTNTNPEQ
jgi:hypothetical protein